MIIDSNEKYEEVLSGIRSKIKTLNGGKELFYEKNYAKIGINTDDDLPLNKPLKFPILEIIIRCYFQRRSRRRLRNTKEKGIKNWFSIKRSIKK